MKSRIYGLVPPLLLATLALSGWKAAWGAIDIVRAPGVVEKTGIATPGGRPVRARDGEPLAVIARTERAIVFVYSPDCLICHANMANWIDLVGELRNSPVRLYAVAPMTSAPARDYWRGLDRRVTVIMTTPAALDRALGMRVTPATLLVSAGRVRGEIVGPLTAAAHAQVRRFAATGTM